MAVKAIQRAPPSTRALATTPSTSAATLLRQAGLPDTNAGGTLNNIKAPVTVNGQGTGDQDLLCSTTPPTPGRTRHADQQPDHQRRGGNGACSWARAAASPTRRSRVLTSTSARERRRRQRVHRREHTRQRLCHRISSGSAPDVFNIETIAGDLSLATGGGSDTVRVGTTTGDVGNLTGVLDAFDSTAQRHQGPAHAGRRHGQRGHD
jgi:hypothetical protein